VSVPLSLSGRDIMNCRVSVFLPASKEVDSTEVVRANTIIVYESER
jgi:hypothetical protein